MRGTKSDPEREALAEVRAVYADLAHRPAERSCVRSTGCCQFRLTGRTPQLTRGEALLAARAFRATGRKALTSRHLALALNRLGFRAVVRDTRLVRWGARAAEHADSARREAFEVAVVAKWAKLVEDYGIRLVLSLDLHWLVSKHLFVGDPNVRAVHSFWMNDVPASLPGAPTFSLDARELIGAAKVMHHCGNDGQEAALRRLGVEQVRRYGPGSPADDLEAALA